VCPLHERSVTRDQDKGAEAYSMFLAETANQVLATVVRSTLRVRWHSSGPGQPRLV